MKDLVLKEARKDPAHFPKALVRFVENPNTMFLEKKFCILSNNQFWYIHQNQGLVSLTGLHCASWSTSSNWKTYSMMLMGIFFVPLSRKLVKDNTETMSMLEHRRQQP